MGLPGIVPPDGFPAQCRPRLEIVTQQVAFVGPPILNLHGHGDEVAGVAQGRGDVDDPPVEKPRAAAVVEEVADVRVTVHDGGGTGSVRPQTIQRDRVGDVDLGRPGERVAQPIPVMVDAVAERHHAIRGNVLGQWSPRHLGPTPPRVLEAHVQRGEVFERAWRPNRP